MAHFLEFTITTYPDNKHTSDFDLEVDETGKVLSFSLNGSVIPGWEKFGEMLVGRKTIERLTIQKIDLEKAL